MARILFIAKHGCGGNQDEDAITDALTSLGHDVVRIHEDRAHNAWRMDADWALFLKWSPDTAALAKITCPKAFYYPDLVDFPSDPSLQKRCAARREWMARTIPHCLVGFVTDGDWQKKHPDKLVWLPQGADQRLCGQAPPVLQYRHDLLFTGIAGGGGELRESWVREMSKKYGTEFSHYSRGIYGMALRDLIAQYRIVVAPDGPITDSYWSNRVFVTLGYGGFLIHPYCARLAGMYRDGQEIIYYRSREEMHALIDFYSENEQERRRIAANGLKKTLLYHTYRNRCEELVREVSRRMR